MFITEKIGQYPHKGRGVANIGPLPCGTDFTPDDAASDVLPAVSGFTLLAYLLRRFGAPTGPGDTFKSLPNWILTTPMQDVFLRVSPSLAHGEYSFGAWIPTDVYRELIASKDINVDAIHAAIKHAARDLMRIVRVRDVMIDAYGVLPYAEWPDLEDEANEDCFVEYSNDPLGTDALRARVAELEKERNEAQARAERAETLLAKGVAEYDAMFAVGLIDYSEPEWVEGARELIEAAAALRGGGDA